ncbi:MAG: hypothetical protein IJP86_07890 [Synergistaceae bacterium]|nr:hypothetical protein [Synergistaceae bacterium]
MQNRAIIDTTRHDTPSLCRKIFRKLSVKSSKVFAKLRVNLMWPLYSHVAGWKPVSPRNYGRPLMVSLTSFPARINTVHKTIHSLMLQDMKPNRIILWLTDEEFPNIPRNMHDQR